MSIRINKERCVGCTRCTQVCPGTLIHMEENKAIIRYPRNCWGCASCVKECGAGAIDFYLGADIGGQGSTMQVTKEGNLMQWQIRDPEGKTTVIEVDSTNSNQY